jgi:hypothetical protein
MTLASASGLPQATPAIAEMDRHIPLEQRQQAAARSRCRAQRGEGRALERAGRVRPGPPHPLHGRPRLRLGAPLPLPPCRARFRQREPGGPRKPRACPAGPPHPRPSPCRRRSLRARAAGRRSESRDRDRRSGGGPARATPRRPCKPRWATAPAPALFPAPASGDRWHGRLPSPAACSAPNDPLVKVARSEPASVVAPPAATHGTPGERTVAHPARRLLGRRQCRAAVEPAQRPRRARRPPAPDRPAGTGHQAPGRRLRLARRGRDRLPLAAPVGPRLPCDRALIGRKT